METGKMETGEMSETYQSRLTGRMFKVERIVDGWGVSLIGEEGKIRCCSTKENLKLFYDRLPPLPTFKNS